VPVEEKPKQFGTFLFGAVDGERYEMTSWSLVCPARSDNEYVDGEKSKWKPNLDAIKDMLVFDKVTERLDGTMETRT
jgi:hypothetical protein